MGTCSAKENNNRYAFDTELMESSNINYTLHDGSIANISSYSNKLITCSDDKRIALFDWDLSDKPFYINGHTKTVNRVCGTNNFIWSTSRDLSIRQWKANGECVSEISECHSLNVSSIAVNKDETYIFSGSRDYSVKCWDTAKSKCIHEYSAPRNIVTSLELHPKDENLIFQGSEDLCVRVWDFRSRSKLPSIHLTGYVYFPLCLSMHSSGYMMATGCKGFDGVGCDVKLWDIRKPNRILTEFTGHTHDVTGCKFTSDGKYLVSCSKDGSIIAWYIDNDITAAGLSQTKHKESQAHAAASVKSTGKYFTCLEVEESRGVVEEEREGCCLKFAAGAYDGSLSFYSMKQNKQLGDREYCFHLDGYTEPYNHKDLNVNEAKS